MTSGLTKGSSDRGRGPNESCQADEYDEEEYDEEDENDSKGPDVKFDDDYNEKNGLSKSAYKKI